MERIDKLLCSTGRWSRREVKELVRQGRVFSDGRAVQRPEEKADPGTVCLTVDGQPVDLDPEIVPSGGPSVDAGVIKGSMNYNVAGVVEGKSAPPRQRRPEPGRPESPAGPIAYLCGARPPGRAIPQPAVIL